ncbi:unnamed protein product [Closterium sp. Naga37s-1]|nr:unnamed protein product [Closterium sp. Naga37s-1]
MDPSTTGQPASHESSSSVKAPDTKARESKGATPRSSQGIIPRGSQGAAPRSTAGQATPTTSTTTAGRATSTPDVLSMLESLWEQPASSADTSSLSSLRSASSPPSPSASAATSVSARASASASGSPRASSSGPPPLIAPLTGGSELEQGGTSSSTSSSNVDERASAARGGMLPMTVAPEARAPPSMRLSLGTQPWPLLRRAVTSTCHALYSTLLPLLLPLSRAPSPPGGAKAQQTGRHVRGEALVRAGAGEEQEGQQQAWRWWGLLSWASVWLEGWQSGCQWPLSSPFGPLWAVGSVVLVPLLLSLLLLPVVPVLLCWIAVAAFLSALASLTLPPVRITAHRVKLPDGRHVAVCEWGAAASDARVTVVVLHGTPSCRLVGIPMINPSLLHARKIRIVSFDRPGIGQSDYHPGWTLHSSASDLLHLASLLSLPPKFWVLGYSGGGPHALAAARFLPERLAGVVLWAGDVNPWDLVAAMVGGGGMGEKRGVEGVAGLGESGGEGGGVRAVGGGGKREREERRGSRGEEWGSTEESKKESESREGKGSRGSKESSGSSGSNERSESSSILSKLHKQWAACRHAALFALSLWSSLPFPARLRFECLHWIPPSVVPVLCPLLFPPPLVRVLAPVVLSDTAIHRALMSYVQWADAQALSHPHTLHMLAATCQEALYQGNVQAVLEDLLLPALPWGFSLADLKHCNFPIHIWQGTEDQDVPVLLSDLLAHLLPCVSLHLLHGHGHYSPFTHPDFHRVFLDTLFPAAAAAAAAAAGDT